MRQVLAEVAAHGTYRHTPEELAFAARVAWRNSSRCIGRLYWRTLRVRDRREVSGADQIAAECFSHLREATNGGRIRPIITVFAPDAPARPGPRIISSQLIGYAGHQSGGSVIGDPAHQEITRLARELGWPGGDPPGRFDLLPLIVQASGLPPAWFELPRDAVLEVPLRHPELSWFRELRLRWYAVPVITDMYLEAGGIRYPAAPFNGWYMCTEIGSRDLGDEGRYNQLPEIASRMGLAVSNPRTLWKDRAVTELNAAVLHSYEMSGVRIADHHTESERFLAHVEKEQRHGRREQLAQVWPAEEQLAVEVAHRLVPRLGDVAEGLLDRRDSRVRTGRRARPRRHLLQGGSRFLARLSRLRELGRFAGIRRDRRRDLIGPRRGFGFATRLRRPALWQCQRHGRRPGQGWWAGQGRRAGQGWRGKRRRLGVSVGADVESSQALVQPGQRIQVLAPRTPSPPVS
jgi:nitric-oxide synthase